MTLKTGSCVASIGFFDGVHRGHLCLIEQVMTEAKRRGGRSLLVTFDRHPRTVVNPEHVPILLTSLEEKTHLLQMTGVDGIVVLPFTYELSCLTAREFMDKVLCRELGVSTLVLGYDHHFGHGGGSWEDYVQWGRETEVELIRANELRGEHVSSSRCRQLLMQGDVAAAASLLGRWYALSGMVVHGFHVGHELGFPTANLQPDEGKLLPANGAYAVWATLADGRRCGGMLNIGHRPTIGNGGEVSIEVNLLDYEGDLYGQRMVVEFISRLREERRFGSREELVAQLNEDKRRAEEILQ